MRKRKSIRTRRSGRRQGEYNPILRAMFLACKPDPKITISEWADQERVLSSESSPEPFRWKTSRAEYQRAIMDAFNDATNRRVVFIKSAQVGATSIMENVVGFYIEQEPSPILIVDPTLDMAKTMSKDRLMPMIRDTPCLNAKFDEAKAADADNTMLHKPFNGGHVTLAGANSPASLASRPIRVLLCDEIDRFPSSAGAEGSPVRLAMKRTANFWNRRIGLFSTPTDTEVGIHAEWLQSDQRRFYVTCEKCGHDQVLVWKQVRWTALDASDAVYHCEECDVEINEVMRDRMVRKGHWQATAKFNGVAGFHINELYSPWRAFKEIATDYLESKDEPEKLRVWVNTSLGEPWQPKTEGVNIEKLSSEPAHKLGSIPQGVLMLTLGVDTQGNRLALQLVGWGRRLEQWVIDHVELPGNPDDDSTWDRLTEYRRQRWTHPLGNDIGISMTAIDSGGHHAHRVVAYARTNRAEGVIAIKGASTILPTMLRGVPGRVDYHLNGQVYKRQGEVWLVGTDTAKSFIMSRLRSESAVRLIHFAEGLSTEYYRQLTAEVYDKKTRKWINPRKQRNEALDTLVYACAAAVHPLLRLDVATENRWKKLEVKLTRVDKKKEDDVVEIVGEEVPAPVQTVEQVVQPVAMKRTVVRSSFIRRF